MPPGTGHFSQQLEKCPVAVPKNFCAASRWALEILTAATRSPRCIRHWRRSVRFPKEPEETKVSPLPCALYHIQN